MRKLAAWVFAFFFMLHTTAALAAPVDTCCIKDCKASVSCLAAGCPACHAPMAVTTHWPVSKENGLGLRAVGPAACAAGPVADIWTPPD